MFQKIFGGRDWRTSPAHLLLLCKFNEPKRLEDYASREEWKLVLQEEPAKAISRFIKEGLLIEGGLEDRLSYQHGITNLKRLLKERNLKVSGNKNELVLRLIENDRKGMGKLVSGLKVVKCSIQGRTLADDYLATVKEQRQLVEEQTLVALRERNFRRASQIVSSYEAEQIFPRGLNIDWKNYDTSRDIAMLQTMFKCNPKVLKGISDQNLEILRIHAGMMYLWSFSYERYPLPIDFSTSLPIDNRVAVQMLLSNGHYHTEIEECRKSQAEWKDVPHVVQISNCNDQWVCESCRQIEKEYYDLKDVPELPYEKCTSPDGCRCWINWSTALAK